MKRLVSIIAITIILTGAFDICSLFSSWNEIGGHEPVYGNFSPSSSIPSDPPRRNDLPIYGWSDTFDDGTGVAMNENMSIGEGTIKLLHRTLLPDEHTSGLWHFDGMDVLTVLDSSGHDNRGTIQGAERSKGIMGGCLEFDGINDFIDFGDDARLDPGANFTVEAWMKPEMDLWSGWNFSKSIVIDRRKVHGTLLNFPLLVSVTDPDLRDAENGGHVQSGGGDLLFIAENGTKLSHEVEEYDGSNGKLVAWVKLPLLSSTSDTTLYLRFGNSVCSDQQDPANVWDRNHKMVHHLDEKEGIHKDSTVNGNNGTSFHGVVGDSIGKIAGCDEFDGTDDYIEIQHAASLDLWEDEITLEAWIYPHSIDAHTYVISRGNDFYAMLMSWRTVSYYFMKAGWKWDTVDSPYGSIYSNDRWYQVAITMEGREVKIYIDGELVRTMNKGGELQMGESVVRIGAKTNNQNFFNGLIDEVRISDTARNASWIETAFENQNEPDKFLKIGDRMGAGIRKGNSYGINANTSFAFASLDNSTISAAISPGWNHIAETYDGKDLLLYVNGEPASSIALPGLSPNSTEKLFIAPSFQGKIDEVRIFDKALTPREMIEHSQAFRSRGSLKSVDIEIPPKMVWDTFSFNRSVPSNTYLNISLHHSTTGERLFQDSSLSNMSEIDISELNPLEVGSVYLEANFQGRGGSTPCLFQWSVNYSSPQAPEQTTEIPRIDIFEDTPEQNVLDLANYFNDIYAVFSPSVYTMANMSEPANLNFSLNGSYLCVDSIAGNWTGSVELEVSCTNVFGISTRSSPFYLTVKKLNDPPLVKLFSPLDGSNLEETAITLTWKGFDIDNAKSELSFDLYFGKAEPPTLHTRDLIGESLSIDGLEKGETYHWYLSASDGISRGVCVSGTWSFTINPTIIPEVILKEPANGTVVEKTEVRASWDRVNVTDSLPTYNIYIGTAQDDLEKTGSTQEIEFLFSGLLNDTTYYWTVIPFLDSIQGLCVNGIWKFHVNLSREFSSQLEIFLNEDNINVSINTTTTFNITINNKGKHPTEINFRNTGLPDEALDMANTFMADPGMNSVSGIITLPDYLEPGPYELYIYVSHGNSTRVLLLHITATENDVENPKGDEKEAGEDSIVLWIVIGLILLFILQAVLIALFRRRKKQKSETTEMDLYGRTERTLPPGRDIIREPPVITKVYMNQSPTIYYKEVKKKEEPVMRRVTIPSIEEKEKIPFPEMGGIALPSVEKLMGPREGMKALPQGVPVNVENGTQPVPQNTARQTYIPPLPEQETMVNESANMPSIKIALDDLVERIPKVQEAQVDAASEIKLDGPVSGADDVRKIEIGWDEDGGNVGEIENDDEMERSGDVLLDEPAIGDDPGNDMMEKDESATALASIPVKKVAISTETGEELEHCPKCDGYFEQDEKTCPHCAEREGRDDLSKGGGMRGLDPTDREESDDDSEPPRRYPEEMIFDDDDVKLEDILEGI